MPRRLKRLHPTVSRPGRCAARIEFCEFTLHEAAEWLALRGHDYDAAPASARLADLYALVRGENPSRPS